MAPLTSVVHCVVDQEPPSFHEATGTEETFAFSVNLSFEVFSDGTDLAQEEEDARKQFEEFLGAVQAVRFHLYGVQIKARDNMVIDHVGPIGRISETAALGMPSDLLAWLTAHKPAPSPSPPPSRYWTTTDPRTSETTLDVKAAVATHRLRASHAWNAPVAHKFGLTHIVHIPKAIVTGSGAFVLPWFDATGTPPLSLGGKAIDDGDGAAAATTTTPNLSETLFDFDYDALRPLGAISCRTTLVDGGALDLPAIDPVLTQEGYLQADSEADNSRRVLKWLEERATSLMAANPALVPPGVVRPALVPPPLDAPTFEQQFGIQVTGDAPKAGEDDKRTYSWGNAPWYAVARLACALDNIVIALLQPVEVSGGSQPSEGELLAPLVSALIERIEEQAAAVPGFKPGLLEGPAIVEAIRKVLRGSPLMSASSTPPNIASKETIRALEHVYRLGDPLAQIDERSLPVILLRAANASVNSPVEDKYTPYVKSIAGRSAQTTSRVLLSLEQVLHEEAGAEAAIVRLMETVKFGKDNEEKSLPALLADAISPPDIKTPALNPAVLRATEQAWADFKIKLDSPFNGAEAVRRAAGSTFIRALLTHAERRTTTKKSRTEYLALAHASQFYERRFFGGLPNALQPLEKILVKPDPALLPAPVGAALQRQLKEAFEAAMLPLRSVVNRKARFVPDSAPQPLPIQIAKTIDAGKIDIFSKHFNGIGIALQRIDTDPAREKWSYAHLADLSWGSTPAQVIEGAIHPWLPAAGDGRCAMFIEYEGFPFADPASEERIIKGEGEVRDMRPAFYAFAPHQAEAEFEKLPRLAYGRAFKSFSFVTSNAGTLPFKLQKDAATPWMPVAAIVAPTQQDVVKEMPYQRRTAIAQMALVEEPQGGQRRRIGAPVAGVVPLAGDYPRIALRAWPEVSGVRPKVPGVRDIFREADGTGIMRVGDPTLPGETIPRTGEWQITGLDFDGTPSKLILRFFGGPAEGPDDTGIDFVIDMLAPGFKPFSKLVLRIEETGAGRKLVVECGSVTQEKPLPKAGVISGWLRVRLETQAGQAGLSFSDPAGRKTDNVSAPLLLLAPDRDDWKAALSEPVIAKVATPRVGYLDFERWFANADLRRDMFFRPGDDADTVKAVEASVVLFEQALLNAYVLRHLDPVLAQHLDRLPDPAVEAVRLELIRHDALEASVTAKTLDATHPLKETLGDFGRKFAGTVARMIALLKKPEGDGAVLWTPQRLRGFLFEPLDELFQLKLEIAPGTQLTFDPAKRSSARPKDPDWPEIWTFPAKVPSGVVARLSIDALVPERHFSGVATLSGVGTPSGVYTHPPVFDVRLKQYAPRTLGGSHLAFPAAAILVETMYDDRDLFVAPFEKGKPVKDYNKRAIALAARMLEPKGIGDARRYSLITAGEVPEDKDQTAVERQITQRNWRVLSAIDATTQRWRPSGRPIYHHVDPRAFAGLKEDAPLRHPALRLGLDPGGDLAQFEQEAFFDRPDVDAHTITHGLEPLPASTTLHDYDWNAPSATYFRHRFTLRSRYAGALKSRDKGKVAAWPTKPALTPQGWTMRVAMLADLSRLQLTRPQLRALIPLTTAPGGDPDRRPAPPVAAILQEPPFARGGLADRIACEIRTGFGYGFRDPKGGKETPVEILRARKEAGPYPQLDYRPFAEESARSLVLRSEGPMGLTFDNAGAPVPAFPNTMLLLKPDNPFDPELTLEDVLVGVGMQRYIDPAWTQSPVLPATSREAGRCWWIDIDEVPLSKAPCKREPLMHVAIGNEQLPLLCVTRVKDYIEIFASRKAIDGQGGTEDDEIAIARIVPEHSQALSLLHRLVAPGRYATAILVREPTAHPESGQMKTAQMVASFEWSPLIAGAVQSALPQTIGTALPAKAYETMASAPTAMRWIKTGRDFDFVHIPQVSKSGAWKPKPTHVRDLVAALDPSHEFLRFAYSGSDEPLWLCSSTFGNPYPVHLHRHLGLITSRFLKELGSPAEIFCRTSSDPGSRPELVDIEGRKRNKPEKVAEDNEEDNKEDNKEEQQKGTIFKPQEQIVRVVEFETPAAILCSVEGAPQTYRQAYFDLVSTGFRLSKENTGTLRLFFRFVGSPAHLHGFSKVTLELQPARDGAEVLKLEIDLDNTGDKLTVGIQLLLQHLKPATVKLLRSDGSLEKVAATATDRFDLVGGSAGLVTLADADNDKSGFFVRLTGVAGAGEFWTDVSLLHSQHDFDTSPFDLEWLFSPTDEDDPAAKVLAPALTTMVEAQARIVAVSPPIPITRH